jgi:sorbitol-specific phosphotransferase system component IIA
VPSSPYDDPHTLKFLRELILLTKKLVKTLKLVALATEGNMVVIGNSQDPLSCVGFCVIEKKIEPKREL